MGKKLQQEIKQSRPFHSLEEEALLNISRTADAMHRALQQVIKPYGLTATQYNALRILRGAGAAGLRCSEVGERLVNQDPDITRLMDRLERQKLVRRRRSQADRRVVHTQITELGLKHLAELDPVIQRTAKSLLRGLKREQLEELIELLEEARTGTGRPGLALRVAPPVGRRVNHKG
jgi:DNA-binding MarR family transcriptional regulator